MVSKAAIAFAKKHAEKRVKKNASVLDEYAADLKFLRGEGLTYKEISKYLLEKHRLNVTPALVGWYWRERLQDANQKSD